MTANHLTYLQLNRPLNGGVQSSRNAGAHAVRHQLWPIAVSGMGGSRQGSWYLTDRVSDVTEDIAPCNK